MKPYEKFIRLVRGKKISIQTHNFPDPDALGSVFGLQYFLEQYGIKSRLVYDGKIDKLNTKKMVDYFDIEIVSIDELEDGSETDYVITVDGQKNNSNFTDIIGEEVACIDHHPFTTDYKYKFVDQRTCGACCSIIASYFEESGIKPSENVATALLYGIKNDTANFTRGVTALDIDAFKFLHNIANNKKIKKLENNSVELGDLVAYGSAFQNTVIYDNVGFASIQFECQDAIIAMVADFICSLESVKISVVYAVRNGGYKFSVRGENGDKNVGVIVCKALKDIGFGGGHAMMAGGYVPVTKVPFLGEGDDIDFEIRRRFLDAINNYKKEDEELING